MEQTKTYNIKVHGIDLIEKSLFNTEVTETDNFNFEVKTQSIADPNKNIIVCFVSVSISKLNTPEIIISKIICGVGFFFENFDTSFDKDEKGLVIIPPEIENMLRSISISTMRGIMFSEFRGTQMHKAILPVIVSQSLVPTEGDIIPLKKGTSDNNPTI